MSQPTRIVVADTSVLINFLHLDRLDLLGELPGYAFWIPEHLVAEITRPEQAVSLKAGLDAGRLQIAVMTDISEVERYDVLRRTLGDGARPRAWPLPSAAVGSSPATRSDASAGRPRPESGRTAF